MEYIAHRFSHGALRVSFLKIGWGGGGGGMRLEFFVVVVLNIL